MLPIFVFRGIMLIDCKTHKSSLVLFSFVLILSTIQSISVAHAVAQSCANGGICVVGDTGPGGGIVFYVVADSSSFSCGPTLSEMCTYLERGVGVGSSRTILWATSHTGKDLSNADVPGDEIGSDAQGVAVGTGYKNTRAIIAQQGLYDAISNSYMAGAAQAFRGGGLSDWYLPSTAELSALHASGFRSTAYTQTSTETSFKTTSGIYMVPAGDGSVTDAGKKDIGNNFIAIRSFSRRNGDDGSVAAAAAAEAARIAALNVMVAMEAAKRVADQKELLELLTLLPSIGGIGLNIGDLTNSLLTKQKCVMARTTRFVKRGTNCPKGYVKRK